MFRKLLIANRGEIACRIMRTASRLGIRTVAVYSDADADSLHVEKADQAVRIGAAPARQSYLNINAIIDACKRTGTEAVHPGYGFLSENAEFAAALRDAGLIFVGPPESAIRDMGLKDAAKRLMEHVGVPVVPGYHGEDQDPELLAVEARGIGFPVLIKARAGGGGKGMRRVDLKEEFPDALRSAKSEAEAAFGDDRVLIEKFVAAPRHIEVQVLADAHGNVVHLFERDCSLQRRHQKVIEEAPAPGMTTGLRAAMGEAAVRAAQSIGYQGAGTVEFLVDASEGLRADRFYFMEMNTRLQVEHPVTEAITGLDLVELQLRVASGEPLPFAQDDLSMLGHAFEARVYAEDPARNFVPQTGTIERIELPDDIARIDTGVRAGDTITPHYDPMIAKVIVHDRSRDEALSKLALALDRMRITGTTTNLRFLADLARNDEFVAGRMDTALIDRAIETLLVPEAEEGLAHDVAAIAAVAALGLPRAGGDSPWDSLVGWRSWGPAQQSVALRYEGEVMAARIHIDAPTRFRVRMDGRWTEIDWPGGEATHVGIDGVRRRVRSHVSPSGVDAEIDGTSRRFEIVDPLDVDAIGQAGGDAIHAPMPGLVKSVQAVAGASVRAGETLLVLEAMKMEQALKAPRDGIIETIHVMEGASVEDDALLLSFVTEAERTGDH